MVKGEEREREIEEGGRKGKMGKGKEGEEVKRV